MRRYQRESTCLIRPIFSDLPRFEKLLSNFGRPAGLETLISVLRHLVIKHLTNAVVIDQTAERMADDFLAVAIRKPTRARVRDVV